MDDQAVWGFGDDAGAAASAQVLGMETAVRRHADTLEELRRQALSVARLSWESPAGRNFRSYLFDRCSDLAGTVDLLGSAADELGSYRRLIRDAELLQHRVGL